MIRINKTALYYGIIFLVLLAAYANAFHQPFCMDDYSYLLSSPNVSHVSFLEMFRYGFQGFFRPTALLILKTVHHFSGTNPLGYHLANFALFYGLVLSLYHLMKKITDNAPVALAGVLLFAAHPVNNVFINYKTVGYVTFGYLMMALASLSYLRFLKNPRRLFFYGLSLLCYASALFSHEITFILPLYLLLLTFLQNPGFTRRDWIPTGGGYAVVFLLYLLWRCMAGASAGGGFVTLAPVLAGASAFGRLLIWYIKNLIAPGSIVLVWDEPLAVSESGLMAAGLFLAAVIVTLFLFARKRDKIAYLFLHFLIGFLPAILAAFTYTSVTRTAIIEPHWFGFSLIGLFTALACLAARLPLGRNKQVFLLIVLIGGLGFKTFQVNALWHKEETYCSYWISVNPFNATPWLRLFSRQKENGETPGREISETRHQGLIYLARGQAYQTVGDYVSALKDYRRALAVDPKADRAWHNRGAVYHNLGDFQRAVNCFTRALQLNPAAKESLYCRAKSLMRIYRREKKEGLENAVLADLNAALRIDKRYVPVYNLKGLLAVQNRDYAAAVKAYSRAISVDPFVKEVHYNRAKAYWQKGQAALSVQDLRRARFLGYPVVENGFMKKLEEITEDRKQKMEKE